MKQYYIQVSESSRQAQAQQQEIAQQRVYSKDSVSKVRKMFLAELSIVESNTEGVAQPRANINLEITTFSFLPHTKTDRNFII